MKSITSLSEAIHKRTFPLQKLIWVFAALFAITVYLLLHERTLNAHDPANYYLAIKYGFSVAAERPHAPGYPLFVLVWSWLVAAFNCDPHAAILILNGIFLFLSIGLCYNFVRRFWGSGTAIVATLLVACNPVVLYYSSVAEIYIYDLFFSLGAMYLFMSCRRKLLPLAFVLLGVAMGFRFSSVILLAPVLAVVLWSRVDKREILSLRSIGLSILGLLLGIAVWIFPFYIRTGGIESVQQALRSAANLDSTVYQNAAVYLSYLLWSVNIGVVIFLLRRKPIAAIKQKWLLVSWFVIPTMFFIFQHYAKGYILLILPSMIIPMAYTIDAVKRKSLKRAMTAIVLGADLSLFFFMPFVVPPVESNLPKAQRSSLERVETAFLRSLSFFAPSYSHIRVADAAITEANVAITTYCAPQSIIIVDNSAGAWAFPRSLQASHPSLAFVQGNPNDTTIVSLFSGSEVDRRYSTAKVLSADTLYYLIDPRYAAEFGTPPEAALLVSGSRISLYRITEKVKLPFWKYFTKIK
ncbi:MAG: glycosyltransferase family 39 protein [Bacteroidota bacterium]|nr:glycosyltransferase family 39 protein [Bacteroidota bacterium]